MGRKLGALPLWGGGPGSPSNNVSPGAEAYLHAKRLDYQDGVKFHLDSPAVWPQYTNVTDKQTDIISDSIERTVYKRSPKNCTVGILVCVTQS